MASSRTRIQGETENKEPRTVRVDDKGRFVPAPAKVDRTVKELLELVLEQLKIANAHNELITGETITVEETK